MAFAGGGEAPNGPPSCPNCNLVHPAAQTCSAFAIKRKQAKDVEDALTASADIWEQARVDEYVAFTQKRKGPDDGKPTKP